MKRSEALPLPETPKYHISFKIEGLPKTTNSGGREHWATKVKLAKKWKYLVGLSIGHRAPKEPLQKAKVILTRHSSNTPDADGLVSSFKHILDGLVEHGVILDDCMKVIGMPDYKWARCAPKNGHITIEVFEE